MQRLEETAHELVKKNNSDNDINDINVERERTIEAPLRAANLNKTIAILRTSCADKHLLDLLTPEDVPESTTKLHRFDETTYVKDKLAAREAAATNAAPFRVLPRGRLFFHFFSVVSTTRMLTLLKHFQPSSQGSAIAWERPPPGSAPVIFERRHLNLARRLQ